VRPCSTWDLSLFSVGLNLFHVVHRLCYVNMFDLLFFQNYQLVLCGIWANDKTVREALQIREVSTETHD